MSALAVVRFGAGGHRFAVEAAQVRGLAGVPPGDAPTAEALLGLAETAGGAAARRGLLVGPPGGAGRPLSVGEPVRLEELPAGSVHPLPALVAARLAVAGVRALALDADGPVLLVDLLALMAAPDAGRPPVRGA